MTPASELQTRLRRYLLGQLDDATLEETEKEFLLHDDVFEELLAAEDELVDDYLHETLNVPERTDFERYFLSTSERQEQLKFGLSFRRYLSRQAPLLTHDNPLSDAFPTQAVAAKAPLKIRRSARSNSPRLFFLSPWRMAAFAAVIIAIGFGLWRLAVYQSPVAKSLVALNAAFRQQRPVEARITNLDYAPYTVTRGAGDERVNPAELRLAELTLLDARKTAAAQHALGKVYLAKKEFEQAIEQFNEALKADPNNAQIYSDLGAALLEKAKTDQGGKHVEDLSLSLGYLRKALNIDGNSLEALFNRALCYQELTLWEDAQHDWEEYLRKDASSQWANEARRRLKIIEEQRKTVSQAKTEILHSFLEHFESHNDTQALQIVARNHARTGNVVVEQLLDAYLEASTRHDQNTASRQFRTLRYIGDLEREQAGERFFSDLADYYQSATTDQKQLIIQARALLKSAYEGWGQVSVEQSLASFHEAADRFQRAGDVCESAVTRYWLSFSYYNQHREAQSLLLVQPLAALCERNGYKWLQVRTFYLASAVQFSLNEHSKAIDLANRSLALAEQSGDTIGALNALTSLTESFRYLGNHDQSLTYIEKSLPLLATISMDPIQGIRVYGFQATALASAGYYAVAADYEKEALRLAIGIGNISTISYSYTFLALINGKLGKYDTALRNAQLAYDTAASHSNDAADHELMAYASLQMGDLYQQQNEFAAALFQYDRAIQLYEEVEQPTEIYQAHKGKLLCFIAQGDDLRAKSEITRALNLVEQYRDKIFEENNRASFFQAQQSLYDLAIDFEYSKMKDVRESFRLSEMSRGRSLLDLIHSDSRVFTGGPERDLILSQATAPLTPEEVRLRMPDETQILQYALLKDKLIIWVISKEKISSVSKSIDEQELKQKVLTFLKLVSSASSDVTVVRSLGRELFQILIEPAASLLDPRKLICIVPDKSLNYLPFPALVLSSGHYLFEDYGIVFSPAASVFIDSCESALQKDQVKSEKLLSVGNPAFDKEAYPSFADLPSAATEAKEIADYYESSKVLVGSDATVKRVKQGMENADVIHLAAHSELDERFPLRSRLLLAKTAGDSRESLLPASEIYRMNLQRARLVVLSACQTGAERYYEGEGMISLVRPFIVDRVPLVVASSWPVDSDATRELMESFHQHRKLDHLSTTEALRRAQKEMLTVSDGYYAHPYYWAAFMVVGGYAKF